MHSAVADLVIVWQLVLVVALTAHAVRARTTLAAVLAMEALSLILVAVAAVLAIARDEPGFLNLALVIGLLGFVQTVAAAEFVVRLPSQPRERGQTPGEERADG